MTYRSKGITVQKPRGLEVRVVNDASVRALKVAPKPPVNRKHPIKESEEIRKRLNLLNEISKKVSSSQQVSELVKQVTQMAQRALNASASSVLLLDRDDCELVFEVVDRQMESKLKQARISAESGIAGWVATNSKPLIVNDVHRDQRFDRLVDTVTGFVTKSIICVPLVAANKTIGVLEVLNKLNDGDFTSNDLGTLQPVAATAAIALEGARVRQVTLDSYKATIKILAAAIDAKDPHACGHSERVSEYAVLGASVLPFSRDERETIEYAAILHDIGKAYISDKILTKPGPLTPEEWEIVHKHPVIGANMLKQIPFLEKASDLVLHHHERFDGTGYPKGLKGEATPIGARLIAVVDAFDTMTTYHSYRVAYNVDYALHRLHKLSGIQFCPIVVQAFISGFSRFHSSVKG